MYTVDGSLQAKKRIKDSNFPIRVVLFLTEAILLSRSINFLFSSLKGNSVLGKNIVPLYNFLLELEPPFVQ